MKDKFTTRAFSEGYLARSVFKLKYIQKNIGGKYYLTVNQFLDTYKKYALA